MPPSAPTAPISTIDNIEVPLDNLHRIIDETLARLHGSNFILDGDIHGQYKIPEVVRTSLHEIGDLIWQTRRNLGFTDPRPIDISLFTQEFVHVQKLWENMDARHDGSDYFLNHLVGSLRILIEDMHITGLTSGISQIGHDNPEDLSDFVKNPRDFFYGCQHPETLSEIPIEKLVKLYEKVQTIIVGVTKVKGHDREHTKAQTFRILLETIRDHGLRVIYTKLADRAHNMATIGGHPDMETRQRIANETIEVYLPLARMLRLHSIEEKLTRSCLEILNPNFLEDFDEFMTKQKPRLTNHADQIKGQIHAEVSPNEINQIRVEPISLSRLLKEHDLYRNIENVTLDDLYLDHYDSHHQIQILLAQSVDISAFQLKLAASLHEGSSQHPLESFGLADNRGILLKLHNRSFGGELVFRINKSQTEAQSFRGLLAGFDDTTPENIRHEIDSVLTETDLGKRSIFKISERRLLNPTISVFDSEDRLLTLPNGATGVDLAAEEGEDAFLQATSMVIVTRSAQGGKVAHKHPLFKKIPHRAKAYTIHQENAAPNITPAWFLFCKSEKARRIIAKNIGQSMETTKSSCDQYLAMISSIFGISRNDILDLMEQNDQNYLTLADGSFDLLGLLHNQITSEKQNKKCNPCTITLNLEKKRGTLSEFIEILKRNYLNILESSAIHETGFAEVTVEFDEEDITTYEFMRMLVKLHLYGYENVKVSFGENERLTTAPPHEQNVSTDQLPFSYLQR